MTRVSSVGDANTSLWTTEDSARVYGLDGWGKGYVGVTPEGHLAVMPERDPRRRINLFELVEGLRDRGIHTPVLIRFTDMLRTRLRELGDAFAAAIAENEYSGAYHCIYPIKVNQQRHLCEEVRDLSAEMGFGLEAGSKPELLAVLGLTAAHPKMMIVCNGFKDREYVETVVLATKLGRNIVPVVERFKELEFVVEFAKQYGVRPKIGLRIKPGSRGAGRWESSGGMRSKFGLSASETLRALDFLKQHGMADCLNLLHFHIGSQICDIRNFKIAVSELAHIYTELCRLGANLSMIDVGGGLGVDYDGSQSAFASSINYTVREYASDVVYRIKSACDEAGLQHPTIISESGRAMVANSTMMVVDVLGRTHFPSDPDLGWIQAATRHEQRVPQPVTDLLESWERIQAPLVDAQHDVLQVYHDAMQAREEALSLFSLGYMSLPMRAACERLFWAIGRRILALTDNKPGDRHDELSELPQALSDIYFCNFSVFQSVPDSWAVDQLFPIVPIHRLDEEPKRRGVLADITCDSDGQIDRFSCSDSRLFKETLELHDLREGEPYYLGIFLLGAYQEVLGDLHNLFGDTHVVHVSLDDEARWTIDEVVEGDTVQEVLSYVQFDVEDLERAVRREVEKAVQTGVMVVAEAKSLMKFYEGGLEGYTYLE